MKIQDYSFNKIFFFLSEIIKQLSFLLCSPFLFRISQTVPGVLKIYIYYNIKMLNSI
ncbi:Uncharacterized protein dnm_049170 [Desulfonema magnum]|uniref:Uncharacterized protein n=1 Tax=Desulfonema magnum TaxID=45655 RepID=A0A975BPU8_9BACT|nr:Uncharacterized protein dnm_049170 [Desulfonema magnum]